MNRVQSLGLILLLAVATACGATPPPPGADGGTVTNETPAFWGFADQTCWTYDDGSGHNLYNIAIEEDTMTIRNVTTYHLIYRYSGLPQREDYLQVVKNTVVDWYHDDYPAGMAEIYWEYSPPPTLFVTGLGVGATTTSTTMGMESTTSADAGTTTTTVPLTFLVANAGTMMVNALGKMQAANELIVTQMQSSGANATADNFWLVPNVGIVQLQLSEMSSSTWSLVKAASNIPADSCYPQ